jgi:hypothetical protein
MTMLPVDERDADAGDLSEGHGASAANRSLRGKGAVTGGRCPRVERRGAERSEKDALRDGHGLARAQDQG